MKLFQINRVANSGSTGRIAEGIGEVVLRHGGESCIAWGDIANPSKSQLVHVGNKFDRYIHALRSRLWDGSGTGSYCATKRLIRKIKEFNPDIIQIHTIEGYFLNYGLLFDYLKSCDIPVVWTFHDEWAFTGHCFFFDYINCEKWKTGCHDCPSLHSYPKSWVDRSSYNYKNKKAKFTQLKNMIIIPVAEWLSGVVGESFFHDVPRYVIHNGIDLNLFKPIPGNKKGKYVLCVSQQWTVFKGYDDIIKLRQILDDEFLIIMVGDLNVHKNEIRPKGIMTIDSTESTEELAKLYSDAWVFINPTYQECLPTTNIEAQACGTPVITYRAGGADETVSEETGTVLAKGDIKGLAASIKKINKTENLSRKCRQFVVDNFNKDERYEDYYNLYCRILKKNE